MTRKPLGAASPPPYAIARAKSVTDTAPPPTSAAAAFAIFNMRVPAPQRYQQPLRSILSVPAWIAVGGAVLGAVTLQAPTVLLHRHDRTRRKSGRLLRDMGVLACQINPMWDFRLHGPLPQYTPRKTVVIANHVSNSDPFLISCLPWEMKWLGKASLFEVPVVGWAMAMAGDIPVERGNPGSTKKAMLMCRQYLDDNMPVMIFPEGTRSRTGQLLPFKDGAFRLAIDAGADILPLAVAGTRTALPKHSWRFGFSRGLVTVGQPITTTGMTRKDVSALKAAARQQIQQLYNSIAPLAG